MDKWYNQKYMKIFLFFWILFCKNVCCINWSLVTVIFVTMDPVSKEVLKSVANESPKGMAQTLISGKPVNRKVDHVHKLER